LPVRTILQRFGPRRSVSAKSGSRDFHTRSHFRFHFRSWTLRIVGVGSTSALVTARVSNVSLITRHATLQSLIHTPASGCGNSWLRLTMILDFVSGIFQSSRTGTVFSPVLARLIGERNMPNHTLQRTRMNNSSTAPLSGCWPSRSGCNRGVPWAGRCAFVVQQNRVYE
jgi:hypothetical protein